MLLIQDVEDFADVHCSSSDLRLVPLLSLHNTMEEVLTLCSDQHFVLRRVFPLLRRVSRHEGPIEQQVHDVIVLLLGDETRASLQVLLVHWVVELLEDGAMHLFQGGRALHDFLQLLSGVGVNGGFSRGWRARGRGGRGGRRRRLCFCSGIFSLVERRRSCLLSHSHGSRCSC